MEKLKHVLESQQFSKDWLEKEFFPLVEEIKKMSRKELKIILDTTRRQANDRLTAVDEEIAFTQEKMRGYGLKDYSRPGEAKKRTITLKSGKVIEVED